MFIKLKSRILNWMIEKSEPNNAEAIKELIESYFRRNNPLFPGLRDT